jgi:hypothetical protein
VGFCDLAAQDQTDPAAVLGGEEWTKRKLCHGGLRNGITPYKRFILLSLIDKHQPHFLTAATLRILISS